MWHCCSPHFKGDTIAPSLKRSRIKVGLRLEGSSFKELQPWCKQPTAALMAGGVPASLSPVAALNRCTVAVGKNVGIHFKGDAGRIWEEPARSQSNVGFVSNPTERQGQQLRACLVDEILHLPPSQHKS